ncbi:lipoprotein [Rodentibacter caecimuris]|uniref:Type IV secretion system putative lipoprotein virB7 n=1 Tax=Rodentibacter caecimuris TaxID=1796644 RepID=A0ABX3KXL6_9PAST|nr:hypothetical protein BKG89_04885 [Rodentibacter heylii]
MNKLFSVLSILALLSACSSPQEPIRDPDALPDGIMLPVEGSGAIGGGSFMPEIEKHTIPNTMK